jgi:hypothetical protein
MEQISTDDDGAHYQGTGHHIGLWMRGAVVPVFVIGLFAIEWPGGFVPPASANHQGREHAGEDRHDTTGSGHAIPGASFQVFLAKDSATTESGGLDQAQADMVLQTVVDALTFMMQHRTDYPRFDESLKKDALQTVIIEPTVVNQDGKTFPFLVARTKDPGRVKMLISASSLKEKGYLNHPEQLVPVLAREFQWVVSKADTSPKQMAAVERDLKHAPIRTDREIRDMSGNERVRMIEQLFGTYLTTVDDQKSLEGQPYYEVGSRTTVPPTQSDSTTKLYDIRVREALQKIVRDAYFSEQTPKAVRSLLDGKIWNVAFVKIDQRDWATRTRVLPEEKSVVVGQAGHTIQPATILVNTYRSAAPDDPFYPDTKGLPMGALSADQLARVIALEIQHNIIEKSMTGHVAQDEMTVPK